MKKKLHLFLMASIASISFVQGAVLTSESFDGSISWNTEIVEDTCNWELVTAGGYPSCDVHSRPGMGKFDSYSTSSGASALLISPAFDLSGCRGEVKFWMYRAWGGEGSPKIEAYISTDDTTGVNATLLGTAYYHYPSEPAADESGWYEFTFQIPESYNSTENYLVLKAISVGAGGMLYIDDISVNSVPKKDASISAFTEPVNASPKGAYDVTVTLENKGSDTLTSCNIQYDINGLTGTYAWTGDLAYLATEDVTIYNDFDFPGGNSSILVYTSLTDDEDLTNDTLDVTLSFTPLPLPYTQYFDSETDFSSLQSVSDNDYYTWKYDEDQTHSSPGAAMYQSDYIYDNWAMLVSPALDLSEQTGVLKFWMYRNDSYGSEDINEIYISTEDTVSSKSALLGSVYKDIALEPVVTEEGWYQYSYVLPDTFNTDENYVIFRANANYSYSNMYIDDISIVPTYKITYSTNGLGTITARQNTTLIDSGSYVEDGGDVIFTATPDEHYVVKQWSINGESIADYTERIYTLSNISESVDVQVGFEAVTYPVSYALIGSEGSLTATVSDTAITSGDLIVEGSDVLFTATPPEHCRVKQWMVNDTVVSHYAENSFTYPELDDTIHVSVEFEPVKYPVIFTVAEGEGTISASVSDTSITSGDFIVEGSTVVFKASPATHCIVKQWMVNDTVVNGYAENKYTMTITDSIDVSVDFETLTYQVTYGVTAGNGSLSAKVGDTEIDSGDDVTEGSTVVFTATPEDGYVVSTWLVDDVAVDNNTSTSYTISSLADDTDIQVSFGAPSSVARATVDKINFYPNPANNGFYIETHIAESTSLGIYALDGKTVLSQFVEDGDYVDISGLEQGVYILKVNNKTSRLIVTKE